LIARDADLRSRAGDLERHKLETTAGEDPLETACGIDAELAFGVIEHACEGSSVV
jgi:hypothetical protein